MASSFDRIADIIAENSEVERDKILPDSHVINDLGIDSLDFLDIVFRLESAFDLKIPEEEIWQGSFDGVGDDSDAIAERLEQLKARRPGFRWDRVPVRPTRSDLPRLITVGTVVEYLEKRLSGGAASPE